LCYPHDKELAVHPDKSLSSKPEGVKGSVPKEFTHTVPFTLDGKNYALSYQPKGKVHIDEVGPSGLKPTGDSEIKPDYATLGTAHLSNGRAFLVASKPDGSPKDVYELTAGGASPADPTDLFLGLADSAPSDASPSGSQPATQSGPQSGDKSGAKGPQSGANQGKPTSGNNAISPLSGASSPDQECSHDVVQFPDGHLVSVCCGGKVAYRTQVWTHTFPGATTWLGFVEGGQDYLFVHNKSNNSYTIHKLTKEGPVEVNKGVFKDKWDSFQIKSFDGHNLLISTNAEKSDTGSVKASGYTLLDSQPHVSDKLKSLLRK